MFLRLSAGAIVARNRDRGRIVMGLVWDMRAIKGRAVNVFILSGG